jgi:hypothetical protein
MSWRAIMGATPAPKRDPHYSQNPHKSEGAGDSEDIGDIGDGISTTTGAVSPAPDGSADDWTERAAIAEHDGGLPESEPTDWEDWFRTETARRVPALGADAANRRVWGIALTLWHGLHGEQSDPRCCAGCGRPVGQGFRLPDGAAIHDDTRFTDCLIRYGQRWRGRATAGLSALGLREPGEGGDR